MNMNTADKIKEIQKLVGVTADGIIGPKTVDAILKALMPLSTEPTESVDEIRKLMAAKILNMEDSRVTGPESLRVTPLPSGDGGGKWEICGISDGIEPQVFKAIKKELDQGNREVAWDMCLNYLLKNTNSVLTFHTAGLGSEFMLRDIIFNMGVGGCVKVMQAMIGVKVDGAYGPNTQRAWDVALGEYSDHELIAELDIYCRDRYNRIVSANPIKKKFLNGWMNRCAERKKYALRLASV